MRHKTTKNFNKKTQISIALNKDTTEWLDRIRSNFIVPLSRAEVVRNCISLARFYQKNKRINKNLIQLLEDKHHDEPQ